MAASGAIIVGSAVNVPGSGRPVDRTYVAGKTPVATVSTELKLELIRSITLMNVKINFEEKQKA